MHGKLVIEESFLHFFNFFFSLSFVEFTVIEQVQVLELLYTTNRSLFATAKLQETV